MPLSALFFSHLTSHEIKLFNKITKQQIKIKVLVYDSKSPKLQLLKNNIKQEIKNINENNPILKNA